MNGNSFNNYLNRSSSCPKLMFSPIGTTFDIQCLFIVLVLAVKYILLSDGFFTSFYKIISYLVITW